MVDLPTEIAYLVAILAPGYASFTLFNHYEHYKLGDLDKLMAYILFGFISLLLNDSISLSEPFLTSLGAHH